MLDKTHVIAVALAGFAVSVGTPAVASERWVASGDGGDVTIAVCLDECGDDIAAWVLCSTSGGAFVPRLAVPWLALDEDSLSADDTLSINVDGVDFVRPAAFDEYGMVGFVPEVRIGLGDPLTAALATGQSAVVGLTGDGTVPKTLGLVGAGDALRAFAANCPPWRDKIRALGGTVATPQ